MFKGDSMKKIIAAIILITGFYGFIRAGDRSKDALAEILPATQSTLLLSATSFNNVVISTPPAGTSVCLDYFTAFSTNTYSVYMLNGSATTYFMTYPGTMVHDKSFIPPVCSSATTNMTLKITTSVSSTTATINHKGYIGR